jgi:hypothetical protein
MSTAHLSTRPVGTVRIFGCGGGGINIAKQYIEEGMSADIAKISACFLDTSDSNLEDLLIDSTFLYTDPSSIVDGSGKVKSLNADLIEAKTPEALRKFPALETNIIVYTASGGTGNVIGYHLHRQLLKAGQKVFSIIMGSAESERTAKNTIGTLASMGNIVDELNKPVIFHWGMTKKGVSRAAVDKEAHLMITALCILGSRRIHGFDHADLNSFCNYTLPRPDIKPALARIRVYDNAASFDAEIKKPIAVAYLKRDPDDEQPEAFAPYLCEGVLPNTAQTTGKALFFGIETESLHVLNKELAEVRTTLASLEEAREAAPVWKVETDKVSKSGLVYD